MELDLKLIQKLQANLVSQFKITDLGLIAYYLEMEVIYINILITVTQIIYISKLLASHLILNYNFVSTFIVK